MHQPITLNIEPVFSFDSTGITCDVYISENKITSIFESWEDIFNREISKHCTMDGLIAVQEEIDGVSYLNNLSDSLKSASDTLEEKVKEHNILLLNKIIEGINIEDATVTFNQYMKGEYE